MIKIMLGVSLTLFSVAIAISLYRIIKGPSLPDRVIAMDMIGVNLISGIAAVSILLRTKAYLEVILVLGLLAFISTISLSRFIERGVIIERKRSG
ncbi:Na(+)/H(+) antiporter subunit F1 [Paenibacillus sp. FSL W8-0186]|uniref:Na(+)/H(+) antiporter subunit F n=1 Tax=Paenibacillus woosongensis TaxID=307580 RepID=A0ABQ4MXL5_9BACL|nr:Na(+)/H(+) antiporter subunit F1 [Paenibacillus woosongensis]GIP60668.1 Na(+)/H(+) antiporter subunit F [Paenibacillus woosongensis]